LRFLLLLLGIPVCCLADQNWQKKIKFGGELRGRAESTDEGYYLHRVRLSVTIEPLPWLRFVAQAQDARVFGNIGVPDSPPYQDLIDLRLGYVELGKTDASSSRVRIGRQELGYGELRLLGPSNWANAARVFDAVLATWRPNKAYRLDAFAASVVNPLRGEFNKHTPGNNLHGLYGWLEELVPNATVEPYLFWRIGSNIDFKTWGTRWVGTLPRNFDYKIEMALQRGRVPEGSFHAWAGHWVLGYTVRKTRWITEYNYATGDDDPEDGHLETFDVLYPTPHDKYGLADRVGWRNIHHLRYGVEYKPFPTWTFVGNYHTWWLATTNDGLYSAPGRLIARMPGAPSHVGYELDVLASHTFSKHVRASGGYGHLFPGGFLKAAIPGRSFNFSYAMVTVEF
jgi:hypothetical protein